MKTFPRRTYTSARAFFSELFYLLKNRTSIKRAMRGELISPAFRERLMMVVTEVNDCRYCRSFHVPQAVDCGLSEEEIQDILAGQLPETAPEEEIPALAYAQHWAEEDAQPDPEYRAEVEDCYGKETFAAVETVLKMIRMGNLMGNTGDYLLYRLSFGRWGQGGSSSQHPRPELEEEK